MTCDLDILLLQYYYCGIIAVLLEKKYCTLLLRYYWVMVLLATIVRVQGIIEALMQAPVMLSVRSVPRCALFVTISRV